MKRKTTLTLTHGGLIAALYVAFTYLSFLFGLSSGAIQLRLSEMLCVIPAFIPVGIPALTIGCLLANLLTGGTPLDIWLGSLATLIGAIGARLLRRTGKPFLISLPTVLSNALIVPFIIIFSAGADLSIVAYPYLCLTVFIGEFLSATVLGIILYKIIEKNKILPKI